MQASKGLYVLVKRDRQSETFWASEEHGVADAWEKKIQKKERKYALISMHREEGEWVTVMS